MSDPSRAPFATPADAEAAFYAAVERCDLEAMAAVWARSDEVVCVHPGIRRAQGRAAVLDSFGRMFAGDARLAFEIADAVEVGDARLAVRHVRERIRLHGRLAGVMAATNVYVVEGDGWRMLTHHASHEGDAADEPAAPEPAPAPPGRTLH